MLLCISKSDDDFIAINIKTILNLEKQIGIAFYWNLKCLKKPDINWWWQSSNLCLKNMPKSSIFFCMLKDLGKSFEGNFLLVINFPENITFLN